MSVLIRGGTVVTPEAVFPGDVRLAGGRIVEVSPRLLDPGGDTMYDATGCYVIPGGIDPHTHLEMPAGELGRNADDWYSGTAAAVLGGTTTVIDMITPERDQTLTAALQDWHDRARRGAVCDYSFHMGIVRVDDAILREMEDVVAAGVPSFKIYLAYKGRIMLEDADAFQVLRRAGEIGALTLVHAENGDVIHFLVEEARSQGLRHAGMHAATRPAVLEGEATGRALALARLAGAPIYIVHVTCREALAAIRFARNHGEPVWAEACAPHLILTDAVYQLPGFAAAPYVLSPPLRSEADREALWEALEDGTLHCTATDHCPWHLKGQKDRGETDFSLIPNGAGGIEERLALLWTWGVEGRGWSLQDFVARTSSHAARIFGLYPRKGCLVPGADADVVVWDPTVSRTLSAATQASRADHCIYEGVTVRGAPRFVFLRGQLAAQEGRLQVDAGAGAWLPRRRGVLQASGTTGL